MTDIALCEGVVWMDQLEAPDLQTCGVVQATNARDDRFQGTVTWRSLSQLRTTASRLEAVNTLSRDV